MIILILLGCFKSEVNQQTHIVAFFIISDFGLYYRRFKIGDSILLKSEYDEYITEYTFNSFNKYL